MSTLSHDELEIVHEAAAAHHNGSTVRWRITHQPSHKLAVVIDGREKGVCSSLTVRSFGELLEQVRREYGAEVERLGRKAA